MEEAEERGAPWHLRRLDRRQFRKVLDELESIPAHGKERQRYCRIVVQDAAPLAGAVCLFLLDPKAWNDAALEAQMRALPSKRRHRRKTAGSSAAAADGALQTGDTGDAARPGEGQDAAADPDPQPGDIKPVRKRRFQQRLEERRKRRNRGKE